MVLLDKIPVFQLAVAALLLGLAPFFPEPHLFEKLRMLMQGNLKQLIDIFDLIMHAALPILLIIKLIRMYFVS